MVSLAKFYLFYIAPKTDDDNHSTDLREDNLRESGESSNETNSQDVEPSDRE